MQLCGSLTCVHGCVPTLHVTGRRSVGEPLVRPVKATTSHISGTRHGPRELEIITAPESSPRRTRARSPPRRFRDPLAIPRSLMAISHSTHGRLTQRPITHGMDPSAVRQPPKSSLIFQRLAPRRRQHHVLLVIVAKQVGEEAGHFGARTHRCHPLVLVARGARDAHGQLVGQQA